MAAGWHQKFAVEAYLPPLLALSKWGVPAKESSNTASQLQQPQKQQQGPTTSLATLVVQWPNCFTMSRADRRGCQDKVIAKSQREPMWVLETHDWAECDW
jgi:hypothetical protein